MRGLTTTHSWSTVESGRWDSSAARARSPGAVQLRTLSYFDRMVDSGTPVASHMDGQEKCAELSTNLTRYSPTSWSFFLPHPTRLVEEVHTFTNVATGRGP